MKIVVIGKGTIGAHVIEELADLGEIIACSRTCKDYPVEIDKKESLEQVFQKIGPFDHLINVAGKTVLVPFEKASDNQFESSIAAKMMGQINCVRVGMKYINKGGSFILTTGYLSHLPVPTVTIPACVNAAIERFVVNVSLEMKNQFRINVVSPAMLEESMLKYGAGIFADYPVVSGEEVAKAYRDMILSNQTGIVKRAGWEVKPEWKGGLI